MYVHSAVLVVAWCLSVTFWHCIKTAERITVGTGTIASLGKATYGDFHISKGYFHVERYQKFRSLFIRCNLIVYHC